MSLIRKREPRNGNLHENFLFLFLQPSHRRNEKCHVNSKFSLDVEQVFHRRNICKVDWLFNKEHLKVLIAQLVRVLMAETSIWNNDKCEKEICLGLCWYSGMCPWMIGHFWDYLAKKSRKSAKSKPNSFFRPKNFKNPTENNSRFSFKELKSHSFLYAKIDLICWFSTSKRRFKPEVECSLLFSRLPQNSVCFCLEKILFAGAQVPNRGPF